MGSINCASNTLHRGEARDFLHAMELVEQACHNEKVICAAMDAAARADGDEGESSDAILDDYAAQARRAADIYQEYLEAARTAAARDMRALGAHMGLFAAALESGDYTALAL